MILNFENFMFTDKTVDYNTERKVLSVRENRTKCIIIIGFLYKSCNFYTRFKERATVSSRYIPKARPLGY